MADEVVYRVQDAEGRGPYRPGRSRLWADVDGPDVPRPFFEEFGWSIKSVPGRFRDGEAGGCGFRTLEQLRAWFSPTERIKLRVLGYSIVRMSVDRVLAESDNQVVFARLTPLRTGVITIPWETVALVATPPEARHG